MHQLGRQVPLTEDMSGHFALSRYAWAVHWLRPGGPHSILGDPRHRDMGYGVRHCTFIQQFNLGSTSTTASAILWMGACEVQEKDSWKGQKSWEVSVSWGKCFMMR